MSTATANPSDLNPQQQAEVNSIITTYKGMVSINWTITSYIYTALTELTNIN